jgi:crotonobetainyl-CoA:carnitine CoA-transferase CaiB-like acyl-CoA transferase
VGAAHLPNDPLHIIDTGHGTRSTVLDLDDPRGLAQLLQLVDSADIFSQSYRPRSLARRGLSPEALAERRPGIIYVTLSAFGHVGPWAERRGFDTLVQAISGIAKDYADGSGKPRLLPVSAIDYITGYIAAFGVMRALQRRAVEGGSYLVRVSLAQTGRWLQSLPRLDADAVAGAPPDLTPERIAEISTTSDGPFGRVRHLAPIAELSATPARWEVPARPLDYDEPAWPEPG